MSKEPRKRAAWIHYRLRLKDVSGADIARQLGVSRRMVAYVINGEKKSPRVREAVAATLEMKMEKVWGKDW